MQTDSYTYIGEWSQNKRTGYGFYYTKSGYYIGDWNNDQKSGVGISQSKNLEIRAIWEDNKPYSICIVRKVGSQELKCALFVEEKIEYVSTDPNKLNHKFSSISVIKYLQQSKKILNQTHEQILKNSENICYDYNRILKQFLVLRSTSRAKVNNALVSSTHYRLQAVKQISSFIVKLNNDGYSQL